MHLGPTGSLRPLTETETKGLSTHEEKSQKPQRNKGGVKPPPGPGPEIAKGRIRTKRGHFRLSPPHLSHTFPVWDLVPQRGRALCPFQNQATVTGLRVCLRDPCIHMSSGSLCHFPQCVRLEAGAHTPRHLLAPWRQSPHAHGGRACITGEAQVGPSLTGKKGGQGPCKGTMH